MKKSTLNYFIGRLITIIFILVVTIACKKEQEIEGEIIPSFHFLNFVDEEGNNLFEKEEITTDEFYQVNIHDGTLTSWDRLVELHEMHLHGI